MTERFNEVWLFDVNSHTNGSKNSNLRVHQPENVSETDLVSDVKPNKPWTPVADVSACDKSVSYKSLSFLHYGLLSKQ